MPVVDVPKPYLDGDDLTESMLDTCFEYLETLLNTTKLDSDNIQSGGIVADNLASASVTEPKIGSSAVTTNKIADDAITTAKILDANITLAKLAAEITAKLVPSGTVVAYGGTSAPTGWLMCDGSAYNRVSYSSLYTVINVFHGNGDGTTTFNVPDYRGRFLRGVDGTAGIDPDKGTRPAMATGGNSGNAVGSIQNDELKSHQHTYDESTNDGSTSRVAKTGGAAQGSPFTALAGGNETRPKNAYVNYIIKI